jgi:hypothetical protein
MYSRKYEMHRPTTPNPSLFKEGNNKIDQGGKTRPGRANLGGV